MTLAIDRQNEDQLCNIFNVADLRGVQVSSPGTNV